MASGWSRRDVIGALTAATGGLAGCFSGSTDDESPANETNNYATADGDESVSDEATAEMEILALQLTEHSTPLKTVAPDAALGELGFLVDDLAGRRLVGMGESTYGTREFFQFRHRLLRLLAEKLGFRVFAWEGNFSGTLALDRYIRTGEGDPLDTLTFSNETHPQLLTESVLELIEWMREFNQGRDPADKLRFYGFDMQSGRPALAELERFFDLADDEFLSDHEDAVDTLQGDLELWQRITTRDDVETIGDFPTVLRSHLDANEADYRETVGSEEFAVAKQHARILEQSLEYATKAEHEGGDIESPTCFNHRDRAMAENIDWILDHEDGKQVALWGHNAHLQKSPERFDDFDDELVGTGVHLENWYGDEYYCLGQEFGRGVVRVSWSLTTGSNVERRLAPRAETVPGLLSKLDEPHTFVDIATAMDDDTLAEWLSDTQEMTRMRWQSGADRLFELAPIGESFDALVFVKESSATNDIESLDD